MINRRGFLAILSGLWAVAIGAVRAQQSDPLAPLILDLTAGTPVTVGRVKVVTPRLADHGNLVPMTLSVESPMSRDDFVRSITLLSPRNPRPLMAKFMLGPHNGRAEVFTRVRLNGTQTVLAIAQLSDGSFWSGSAEVEVTESACLDAS